MAELWVCKEAEEGVEAVYAAVHVIAWHRRPAEPKVLFDRASAQDIAACPKVAALVEALRAVEWVEDDSGCLGGPRVPPQQYFCPWCHSWKDIGHKPDCKRQVALAALGADAPEVDDANKD